MKQRFLKMGIYVLVLFSFVATGAAEDTKIGNMTLDELKAALGLSVYVQGGYTYNFEDPESQENELRVFDHKANSFTLDLAQLIFIKDAPVNGVGYKVKLSAGETAKFIHATGLGSTGPGESPQPFDLTEAYISYVASLGHGLRFDFGKFVTYHGAEVIEAKDNMNYSRSLLFNFAIPFTHTGLKVSYAFSDMLSAGIHIVNGWDNFNDEGTSKTIGVSVNVVPIEQLSMSFNLMNGREVDLQTGVNSNRFLFDWVGTLKPVKNLTVVVNADYGRQTDSAPDGDDATWYGAAGYVKYDFTDLFSLAGRGEYFKDSDGARTFTDQTVKEITITPEFRLAKNFLVRPEYRHDWSNEDVFDSGTQDTQDTIAVGVMYTW